MMISLLIIVNSASVILLKFKFTIFTILTILDILILELVII